MKKFWNWIKNEESGIRTLRLDGVIASDAWFDDDVTPKMFQEDLNAGTGDIVVWINSPGGDCGAAAQKGDTTAGAGHKSSRRPTAKAAGPAIR